MGASPGTAVGTLRAAATGTVDLSAYFPGSVTPAAACAAITGGCVVSQLYDQSGSSHPLNSYVSSETSGLPAIVFSGINGLPVINFSGTTSLYSSTTTLTMANPITYSVVMKRTGDFTGSATRGFLGASNTDNSIEGGTVANSVSISSATNVTTPAATDNAWNALQGLQANSSTCTININGTDATAGSCNDDPWSSSKIVMGIQSFTAQVWIGEIAEGGIISTTTTSTQRGNLCHNQNAIYAISGVSC